MFAPPPDQDQEVAIITAGVTGVDREAPPVATVVGSIATIGSIATGITTQEIIADPHKEAGEIVFIATTGADETVFTASTAFVQGETVFTAFTMIGREETVFTAFTMIGREETVFTAFTMIGREEEIVFTAFTMTVGEETAFTMIGRRSPSMSTGRKKRDLFTFDGYFRGKKRSVTPVRDSGRDKRVVGTSSVKGERTSSGKDVTWDFSKGTFRIGSVQEHSAARKLRNNSPPPSALASTAFGNQVKKAPYGPMGPPKPDYLTVAKLSYGAQPPPQGSVPGVGRGHGPSRGGGGGRGYGAPSGYGPPSRGGGRGAMPLPAWMTNPSGPATSSAPQQVEEGPVEPPPKVNWKERAPLPPQGQLVNIKRRENQIEKSQEKRFQKWSNRRARGRGGSKGRWNSAGRAQQHQGYQQQGYQQQQQRGPAGPGGRGKDATKPAWMK